MRTRPKAILVHLSDQERELLDRRSRDAGVSRAAVIRLLLRGALLAEVTR
ncbi:MAG: ribbon-helix-helix protein, CopG family [Cytophagia bacterium]|jgi:hypothetical protein|nr:ribbon-helix-helix protein, CopG family [Cytophagia bacterium]NBW38893.1 ribbon-helix-helix protein, CopG family [Cytophagia bacterium]